MASKLVQLQRKAAQTSQFVAKNGGSYFKQLMEQNKQYIQDPPTIEKFNLLAQQLFYTRLASIPSCYETLRQEVDYLKHLWKNRHDEYREGWHCCSVWTRVFRLVLWW